MIELSLSKLILIGIVALFVIGPDKLPDVARKAGAIFRRSRHWMEDMRSDTSRDIHLDGLNDIRQTVQEAAQEIHASLSGNCRIRSSDTGENNHGMTCGHTARIRRFRLKRMEKTSMTGGRKPSRNAITRLRPRRSSY